MREIRCRPAPLRVLALQVGVPITRHFSRRSPDCVSELIVMNEVALACSLLADAVRLAAGLLHPTGFKAAHFMLHTLLAGCGT